MILLSDYHVSIFILSQDEFLYKYHETAHAVWRSGTDNRTTHAFLCLRIKSSGYKFAL